MFLNSDFRAGPAMALPGLSRSTDDSFYSDPSLRREVTGRNVFNCCLEQPPQISLGAGRAQYGNSPRYLCQLRDKARWANCA